VDVMSDDLMRELAALIDAAAATIAAELDAEKGSLFVYAEREPEPIGWQEAVVALRALIDRVIREASEDEARAFFETLLALAARHGRRGGAWR
jgi:hypothetical protein